VFVETTISSVLGVAKRAAHSACRTNATDATNTALLHTSTAIPPADAMKSDPPLEVAGVVVFSACV
jgi:hypothetical protein